MEELNQEEIEQEVQLIQDFSDDTSIELDDIIKKIQDLNEKLDSKFVINEKVPMAFSNIVFCVMFTNFIKKSVKIKKEIDSILKNLIKKSNNIEI